MQTFFNLPGTVRYCARCVVSNQRPSSTVEFKNENVKETIRFNDEGVCSACLWHEQKFNSIDWRAREAELVRLLDQHRGKSQPFDIIIPGSGGKDSIFVANELKTKYGMTPLTVTWAPIMYTDIGWRNFQAWLDLGFANVTITPNREFRRRLTAAAFKNLCHPFQPFILGQKRVAVEIAMKYGVPLVMYGESQAEGGTNIAEAMSPLMPSKYFSAPEVRLRDVRLGGIHYDEWRGTGATEAELSFYLPNSTEKIEKMGIEVHHYGYYQLWKPQERFYYAVQMSNFQPNSERSEGTYSKYSSLDDKIDGFHYYTTFIKFGVGRATYDAAQEIRNHHLTREEGIALVHKYDGEFPKKYFDEFLDYCSLTEDEFWETINKSRSPHLWNQKDGEWELKHQVS